MSLMTPPRDTDALDPAQESQLDADFDALRRASESLATPAGIETQLLSAFHRHHASRAARQRWRDVLGQWFAPGFALAASVGMSAWMVLTPLAQVEAPVMTIAASNSSIPFIALQSLEQIEQEPRPRLIEAAVPRTMLAAYGVPVSPESAGDSVRAEMLVSANGQPLAMRFVP